jgi:phosphoribosyl-dephospho-CoA transferase
MIDTQDVEYFLTEATRHCVCSRESDLRGRKEKRRVEEMKFEVEDALNLPDISRCLILRHGPRQHK